MVRETLNGPFTLVEPDDLDNDPRSQYNMGTSQNFPVHIPTFLQKNEGDPAVKVNAISTHILPILMHPELYPKINRTSTSSHQNSTSTRGGVTLTEL